MGHAFSYRVFMAWLDLDELPELFDGHLLWSARRPAPAWFRRSDHFGPPDRPLAECVRECVEQHTGRRPQGPIRLLTHLRYLGHCFNPLSLYYCYHPDGRTVEAIVAEVSNTPWHERHCYVLAGGAGANRRFRHDKTFPVSPFLPMKLEYDWRLNEPGRTLAVHIAALREGTTVFDATLALRRTPITRGSLARVLLRYPPMTLRVVAGIYWNALRLWRKGAPWHGHPATQARTDTRQP